MNLSFSEKNNSAILQTWYPGARGGKAVADILFGNTSPSGKLPITLYRNTEDLPEFTDYSMKNRTYRYYEGTPLYPFGYGLTYGDVECMEAVVGETEEGKIAIHVKVKNQGQFATDDVIQLYLKNKDSEFAVRNTSLCGFKRVNLAAGEEKEVEISIPKSSFEIYDSEGNRRLDDSQYEIYAGTSQPDERSVKLTGKKPIKIELELKN